MDLGKCKLIRQGVTMASTDTQDARIPSPIEHPETEPAHAQARLKKLKESQSALSKIQAELEKFVDAVSQNPSIFSKASKYWGTRPLWQKIIAGLLLSTPPLLGLLGSILVGVISTTLTLIFYAGFSMLLDDHHKHGEQSTNNIKSSINNLASGLTTVISSLEQISEALAEQVSIFTNENNVFSGNMSTLTLHLESLQKENTSLKEAQATFHTTVSELKAKCDEYSNVISEQSQKLIDTQALLDKITVDYDESQRQLEGKVGELSQISTRLSADEALYKQTTKDLLSSLQLIKNTKTPDEHQIHQLSTQLTSVLKLYTAQTKRNQEQEKARKEHLSKTQQLISSISHTLFGSHPGVGNHPSETGSNPKVTSLN
jgi:DNA repair exonuclease SbcCD ATPase subunit